MMPVRLRKPRTTALIVASSALGGHGHRILAPLILTLSIGLIFIVPFVYTAVEVARETHVLVQYLVDARRNGIAMPDWVEPGASRVAYLWYCRACDYRFEAVAYFDDRAVDQEALAA